MTHPTVVQIERQIANVETELRRINEGDLPLTTTTENGSRLVNTKWLMAERRALREERNRILEGLTQ